MTETATQPAQTPPKLRLRGLKKSFGPKHVLNGFDLTVAPRESVVLLGASGSGKSVILKCILGLVELDAGTVEIDGVALSARERRARIGMLFQGGALFDSLKVWQNVAFAPLNAGKMPPDEARAAALEKLAMVGLTEASADLSPAELSGGMSKRVGLARAIMTDPEILLFDEPTTGLDPANARRVDDLIARCCAERRATALTVTHDLDSARRIASRAVLLKDGETVWDGPTDALSDGGGDPNLREFMGLDGR